MNASELSDSEFIQGLSYLNNEATNNSEINDLEAFKNIQGMIFERFQTCLTQNEVDGVVKCVEEGLGLNESTCMNVRRIIYCNVCEQLGWDLRSDLDFKICASVDYLLKIQEHIDQFIQDILPIVYDIDPLELEFLPPINDIDGVVARGVLLWASGVNLNLPKDLYLFKSDQGKLYYDEDLIEVDPGRVVLIKHRDEIVVLPEAQLN